MRALAEALAADEAQPQPDPVPPRPAPKFELSNISHTHEAVMNWMITNPEKSLRECAAHFRYTQSWLSVLIHSDLFQARLKEKQEQVFALVAQDVPAKLGALANIGTEKLLQQMEKSEDPKFIHEVTKTALASLGFGSKGAGPANNVNAQNVQQNFYVASQADLEAARGMITGGPRLVSGGSPQGGHAPVDATLTQPAAEPVASQLTHQKEIS
jgi:hypothetical protein